jgi:prolyl-tRNA editing enzyme YbaK/EbsC (Cys-tRNA(Pro) deacylase)
VVTVTAMRTYLEDRGVHAEELPHEPVHTAIGEAVHLGVPAGDVAKTIVLDTRDGHALAVIPASARLDMRLVHDALGDGHARLASEDELRRDFPDFELGAFPPLGSLLHAPVFVDPAVMRHETIVFAAGRADTSLRARTEALFRDEDAVVTPLVRDEDDKDTEAFR